MDGKSTAATWSYFDLMDEVLGQRHSINPPVLLASVPDDVPDTPQPDTPGGSGSAGPSDSSGSGSSSGQSQKKKGRARDNELLELIKEDMQLQREAQERRAQESRERMDRLFSLLEPMADRPK